MGFWNLFSKKAFAGPPERQPDKWAQAYHKGEKILPSSQMPPVRNPGPLLSEPVLSEPVNSIIQTLKGGEWSFNTIGGLRDDAVYFTHEWFGHQLTVYNFSHCKTGPECQSGWMTQDEKYAVGSVCWQIYMGRVQWEKEQSLAKQRESFMVLVKEK